MGIWVLSIQFFKLSCIFKSFHSKMSRRRLIPKDVVLLNTLVFLKPLEKV